MVTATAMVRNVVMYVFHHNLFTRYVSDVIRYVFHHNFDTDFFVDLAGYVFRHNFRHDVELHMEGTFADDVPVVFRHSYTTLSTP